MRYVPKTEVLCSFTRCQSRGEFLTCYHDTGKVGYRRCELYQLRLTIDDINKRGLEGEVKGGEGI